MRSRRQAKIRVGTIQLVAGLLAVSVLSIVGCQDGGSGAASKLEQAKKARENAAAAETQKLVDAYIATLTTAIPEDLTAKVGAEHPISVWRKSALDGRLIKLARTRVTELSDTANVAMLQDALLLFEAVSDYWLGKEVKGPEIKKEWEEGYEESKKVAAKEGERERIPLPKYMKQLKQLAGDGPYALIGDFELLLPHILHAYKFRTYRGVTQMTSFSPYWQVLYDFKRLRDAEGPEQYQPYRDRLCKEKLDGKCAVPYESRDIVLKRIYFGKLLERIAEFRKKYPESGLGILLDRAEKHIAQERELSVVPEEYPVLPDTKAHVWASPYTVLKIGTKGAELSTDDPDNKDKRRIKVLAEAPDSWDLNDAQSEALSAAFQTEIQSLREDGATVDYTTQVYLHFDASIPLTVLATVASSFNAAGIKLIDFVGRRRFDGTLQLRRVPGSVPDAEARIPFNVGAKGSRWGCTPLSSLAETNVVPSLVSHEILVSREGITAGPKGKIEVQAPLDGDLDTISAWVKKTDQPTLVGVHTELNYEQLHTVLNAVAVRCEDTECAKTTLVNKLLLALCGEPVPDRQKNEKKKKRRRK